MAPRKQRAIRIVHDVAAVVVCLIFLGPVLWALYSAFRPSRDWFTFPPNLSLNGFSLQNFQAVFASGDVARYAFNPLLVGNLSAGYPMR